MYTNIGHWLLAIQSRVMNNEITLLFSVFQLCGNRSFVSHLKERNPSSPPPNILFPHPLTTQKKSDNA